MRFGGVAQDVVLCCVRASERHLEGYLCRRIFAGGIYLVILCVAHRVIRIESKGFAVFQTIKGHICDGCIVGSVIGLCRYGGSGDGKGCGGDVCLKSCRLGNGIVLCLFSGQRVASGKGDGLIHAHILVVECCTHAACHKRYLASIRIHNIIQCCGVQGRGCCPVVFFILRRDIHGQLFLADGERDVLCADFGFVSLFRLDF